MRATLNLPDSLIKDLLDITGEKTKTKAICLAIEDFVRRRRRQKLIGLSGKIHFDLDWEEMEARELAGMKEREKLRNNR
jgi:Arc/MetJ family transcription regulator